MERYLAVVWNGGNPAACEQANQLLSQRVLTDWRCALSVPGLSVFLSSRQNCHLSSCTLPDSSGFLVGTVFSADVSRPRAPVVDELATSKPFLVSDPLTAFTKKYWGRYVAFFRNHSGTRTQVLRDCSGHVPCYRLDLDQVQIFASQVEDLKCANAVNLAVDWQYIAAFLCNSHLQTRRTALVNVSEVLAGEAVDFHNGGIRQYCAWAPTRIVRDCATITYEDARAQLRETVQFCIDCLALDLRRIVLRLSGGLDSAIVLGSLMRTTARPNVTCVHDFTGNPDDDERPYARLAAASAKFPLLELPRPSLAAMFNSQLAAAQVFAIPNVQALFSNFALGQSAAIADTNADAIWTGEGGDHLFMQAHTPLAAADHFRLIGCRPSLLRAIRDSAHLSREPYLHVLWSAWRLGRDGSKWTVHDKLERTNTAFVNVEAIPSPLDLISRHAWTDDFADVPSGKQLQIFLLSEILNRGRWQTGTSGIAETHPLVSQPIIELCLRIPTYELLRGGRQRALARDAFADRVPAEILAREDKGDTAQYIFESIRSNARFFRETILNGALARERLINRRAVESLLVEQQSFRPEHLWPILACAATELWLRHWWDVTSSARAA